MLALIYHSWFWIAGISAIAGIATIVFSAKKRVGLPMAAEILRLIVFAVICSFGAAALATQHFFVEVPDICDQTLANAKTTLKGNDLNFAFALNCEDNSGMEQLGIVNYQSIDSGEIVLKGTTITIAYQQPEQNSGNDPITGIIAHESDSLSSNTNSIISQFTVPNVVGMEQGDACDLLQLSGLQFQVWWDYRGASSGFLLSSSTIQKGIYLNKGHYTLSFTTESNCFDVELEIDHSGNYKIQAPN